MDVFVCNYAYFVENIYLMLLVLKQLNESVVLSLHIQRSPTF